MSSVPGAERAFQDGYGDDFAGATDIANVEKYRPAEASHELNMHSEQIPGKVQLGPKPGAGPSVVVGTAEVELLKTIAPDIAEKLATMSNDQRQMVKNFIAGMDVNVPLDMPPRSFGVVDVPKPKRREMTEEQKERARLNLAKAREARAAKRQEE